MDGFEDSIFKAKVKAFGLQGQGQNQSSIWIVVSAFSK